MKRELLTSGVSIGLLRMLGGLLAVVVTIVLGRHLGPSGLGIYAYAVTCLTLATVPVSYGWSTLLLKTVSENLHDEDWSQTKGLAIKGTHLALLFAILLWIILLAASVVAPHLLPEALTPLTLTVLVGILLCDQLSALRTAILRGLDYPVIGQIPEMLVRPTALILGALLIFTVAGESTSVFHAFVALIAAAAVSVLVGQGLLWRKTPGALSRASARFSTRAWLAIAAPIAASSGLMVLNGYVDLLVLGSLGEVAQVGLYRVALQVGLVSGMAYTALNMLANQRFAYLRAAGELAQTQTTATFMARIALLCAIPIPIVLILRGREIIAAVFGEAFIDALEPMVILALGQCLNAATGMARTLLIMSGQEKTVALITVAAVLGNLLCCLVLIPRLGMSGAALANLIAAGGLNLTLWAYARKVTDIDTSFIGLLGGRPS
ncbi:MAG: oligosaccharide flippase family protein [Acidobacteriota bacterium]